jgi:hypothetical protein
MRSQHLGFGGGTKLKKKIRGAKLKKKKKKLGVKFYNYFFKDFFLETLGP